MNPMNQIETALHFAMAAHHNHLDISGVPYIYHPMRVSAAVSHDQDLAVVGLLHDVVEDTPVTLYQIHDTFGYLIGNLVDAVTRRKLQGESYEDFIFRIKKNDMAVQVKLADIADNTLPWRLGRLTEKHRNKLVTKYNKALMTLLGSTWTPANAIKWLDNQPCCMVS